MAKRKRRKSHIRLLAWLLIIGLAAIAYGYGRFYYQKQRQLDQIAAELRQPKSDLSADVVAADPDLQVTRGSLKPLQLYFQHNPAAAGRLVQNLRQGRQSQQIKLVTAGHYWLFFPRYKLRLPVYQPQVQTNNPASVLTVNGRDQGKMAGGGQNYYRALGMIFPGRYYLSVAAKISGRRLKADSVVNIWSSKTINLIVRTATFQVRSVPDGMVYLNDRPVKKLDGRGQALFKNYPLNKHLELFVKSSYHGRSICSYPVRDLAIAIKPAFSASDDEPSDYSGSNDYTGNQKNDVYQDVEGDYIVNPLWPGLITAKKAAQILAAGFQKPQAGNFTKGKHNSDYRALRKHPLLPGKQERKVNVRVKTILPAGKNHSLVNYEIIFSYRQGRKRRRQRFNYEHGLFQLVKDKQLIRKLGTEVMKQKGLK